MKKIICSLLSVVLMFGLVGCGSKDKDSDTPVKTDEGLLMVDITMDKSFFTDMTTEEIQTNSKDAGFVSCKINDDGSVTYTMTKSKHKEFLTSLKKSAEESVDALINGEDKVDSFVKIDMNDDLSKCDVYVDASKYTAFDSLNVFVFYLQGAYYQMFNGKSLDQIDVVVNFINNETKEVIDTASYKEALKNANNE